MTHDPLPQGAALRALWEGGADAETFVDECLAAVVEALGADRAIVFLGHASGLASPWRGRDRAGAISLEDMEDSARSPVERALADRALAAWDAVGAAHLESGMQLGILAAVAAPIGDPTRGRSTSTSAARGPSPTPSGPG